MKIYLDIDGVLVGRGRKPALYVTEFLAAATKHDCYWATTHCRGDTKPVLEYLKKILPPQAFAFCKKIKTTDWKFHKTEALDFTSDFVWFDDVLFDFERDVLISEGHIESYISVDLIKNPKQLILLTKLF